MARMRSMINANGEVIVEIKNDSQIEDAVVQAKKDFAQQIAVASGMEYQIIKSSDADRCHYRVLL